MRGNRILAFVMMLGALILAACSGSYPGVNTSSSSSGGTQGPQVASLTLLASASQLPSAANTTTNGITITAIAKDANNALVEGATIVFGTSAGALQSSSVVTDASGTATNILTAAGDPANQVITVSAVSGTLQTTLQVQETGTSISITGPAVVGSGDTATYTIKVVDSSGNGIQGKTVSITSALGNGVVAASSVTDATGQITATYTGTKGGSDTLSASVAELNASGAYGVAVSASKLVFLQPAANALIKFGTVQPVQVQYTQSGAGVSGATITFSTTRGTLSAASAVTDANGKASVTIQSNGGAGGAIITAQAGGGGPSANVPITFVATTPATIDIQASPSTIAPSGSSTITAVVRDASKNYVQGKIVNFSLTDTSGGSLSAASATTDQLGTATIQYNASTTSSSKNGVVINATVQGTAVTTAQPAYITVGGQALHITLGTGNTISALDDTRYQLPYSVIVADSAGNPPPSGTTFSLSIRSTSYQKGTMYYNGTDWVNIPALCTSSDGGAGTAACGTSVTVGGVTNTWAVYVAGITIFSNDTYYDGPNTPGPWKGNDIPPFGCVSEDANNDGIWTAALDYNGNGVLDPGSVATVPQTLALDSTGSAQFEITYPKDHAYWVEVQLTGIATVAGNSTTATATFVLPGLAKDYSDQSVPPPGPISPYGTGVDTNGNLVGCASPD